MIKIIELEDTKIPQAKKLVREVFPEQDFMEKASFWFYKHRNKNWMKPLCKVFRMENFSKFWIAVGENGDICGTTGFYAEKKDFHEAVWLSWFCVDPKYRGQGIGKQLLEFSITTAREYDKKYLRLYTSDHPGEAEAQFLYEKYGFKEVGREKDKTCTLIYREKLLHGKDNPCLLVTKHVGNIPQ